MFNFYTDFKIIFAFWVCVKIKYDFPPSDILYLKADNSYTQIVQVNGKKMITSRFLKNFEESLKGFPQFFRCHKSYIVNTDYTESFNKSNGGTIIIKDKIEIPISQDKVEEFLSIFKKIERK